MSLLYIIGSRCQELEKKKRNFSRKKVHDKMSGGRSRTCQNVR